MTKSVAHYHIDLQSWILAPEPASRAVCDGEVPSPCTDTQTIHRNLLGQYATLWLNAVSFSIHIHELFHAFLDTVHF